MIAHRRFGAGEASQARPDERGETLIEIMATVVLIGVAVVALVTSLITALTTSSLHREIARTSNEAVNTVEGLRLAAYKPCARVTGAASVTYNTALPADTRVYDFQIVAVDWLVNAAAATPTWVAAGGSCSAATDQGAQRITVRVTSNGTGNVKRELVFVKRNKDTDVP